MCDIPAKTSEIIFAASLEVSFDEFVLPDKLKKLDTFPKRDYEDNEHKKHGFTVEGRFFSA